MSSDVPQSLSTLEKAHLWHPFTPMDAWCAPDHEPLFLVSGRGCTLTDAEGRTYLDGNSSIWTNIHGHCHPTLNAAIGDQLQRVAHTSFLGFTHPPAAKLAAGLVEIAPGEGLNRVFFSDNGSTAIEAAVRMALQFHQQSGAPERRTLVAFDRAYHGDTLGAASLSGLSSFTGAANDFGYTVRRISTASELADLPSGEIAAVVIEPLIQGAAGMRLWPAGMLRDLRQWCDAHGALLILDEVMTGFGRTGKMFACEHEGVTPDFLCLAKGLTGGYLPMAVTLTTEVVFKAFLGSADRAFYYGHSYTGSQLGAAAALASLQIFRDESTLEHLPSKCAVFSQLLSELKALPQVLEVRRCGLVAGVEVDGPVGSGAAVCLAARTEGLLTRPIGNTIVLMPPLCITDSEQRQMISALSTAIRRVLQP